MNERSEIEGDGSGAPDAAALGEFFGYPVPEEELAIWAAIPPSQRSKALQRLKGLDSHNPGGVPASKAAADAGVKLNRFYQMARAWEEKRSLASVGAFASTTQTRQRIKPEVAQAIQAAVVKVVDGHKEDSVTALVRRLADEIGTKLSPNTLRQFVERELRRRAQRELAGEEIQFDCAATSMRRSDGSSHVAFLAIDGGKGLVLGHAIGDVADSAGGYAAAAADARHRIFDVMPPRNMWVDVTARSQLVPGLDGAEVAALVSGVRDEVGGIAPQLVRARAYGRYARPRLGLKIGPIRLSPTRTGDRSTPADWNPVDGLSQEDAQTRLAVAVNEHNDGILAALDGEDGAGPPDNLRRLLEAMARRVG